ncbi:hypothetical protein G6F68_017195 [Rhizopus microsporus]|nr:hypothetical protein G6F68_017195 [Rhizopus microsporus]
MLPGASQASTPSSSHWIALPRTPSSTTATLSRKFGTASPCAVAACRPWLASTWKSRVGASRLAASAAAVAGPAASATANSRQRNTVVRCGMEMFPFNGPRPAVGRRTVARPRRDGTLRRSSGHGKRRRASMRAAGVAQNL